MTKTYTHTIRAEDHPIKSVTIFKSYTAEVVRTFSIDLQPGENRIEIKGLSSEIDVESARVSGLGEGVRLFDVVCTVKAPLYPEADDPSEEIRRLKLRQQELQTERKMREHETDILINYGKSLNGEHVSPEQASGFLEIFLESGWRNMKAVTKLTEELTDIDRLLARQEEKIGERTGSADCQVVVTLSAKSAGPVELKLTYIVNSASWQPTYDLHASTEDGRPSSSVNLQYRARIMQNTGEDWKDTALTLSTSASDASGNGVPALQSLQVSQVVQHQHPMYHDRVRSKPLAKDMVTYHRTHRSRSPAQSPESPLAIPTMVVQQLQSAGGYSGGWFGGTAVGGDPPQQVVVPQSMAPMYSPSSPKPQFEEIVQPGPLAEGTTFVSESPLSMTYTVEGTSTIPSDGIAHQVLIASLPFEGDVTYVAVPRVESVAYLQCEVKNTSDYRLLPGPVSVFLDDGFVSKTRIQDVNSGDTFQCTLGADPSIRLTFVRTSSTGAIEGGAFAEKFKTTTYKTVTTIRNKHRFTLTRMLIRDSVPLVPPEDKRTRVVLRKPTGLADSTGGADVAVKGAVVRWFKDEEGKSGEKDGKMEWEAKVESGGEVTLELEYEVRGPAEAEWTLKAN